jgi:D-alanine--poly(phosphoribitol) ligase subunit 1
MITNVLEYLESACIKFPNKVAYSDGEISLTFDETQHTAKVIGTRLIESDYARQPVAVFMKRGPETLPAYLGVVQAGGFYIPLDEDMPSIRMEMILEKVQPKVVICDKSTRDAVNAFDKPWQILDYHDVCNGNINQVILDEIRSKSLDTDPLYIVFTSGSTGTPKGVIANHRSVIEYVEQLSAILGVTEDTIFGNQTPLYLDASLKEVYPTLKYGATAFIIPKSHFMFPMKLVEYMNQHQINTICWVVSALTIISGLKVLEKVKPEFLHTVAFGSEVFPISQFNLWKKALPEARFINLYGPTEATGMSCYYEVNRDFSEGQPIPIGKAFNNTEILLIDENGKSVEKGKEGEIYIRGTCVTMGYYKDEERTKSAFVQNPLNDAYPEIIYKTGDMGYVNQLDELVFSARKDHQIKHMGHRIELGEIEAGAGRLEGVIRACSVYEKKKSKIFLYYEGDRTPSELSSHLSTVLPRYMVPNKIEKLDALPLTPNGKINRMKLAEMAEQR